MDIIETRRENLRRWLKDHETPPKEKSLFSQLKGTGSFGEKVARRLEEQYGMGAFYLDEPTGDAQQTGAVIPFIGKGRRVNTGPSEQSIVKIKAVTLRLQAGVQGFEIEDGFEDGGTIDMSLDDIEKRGLVPQCLIAIKVTGESMEPMLYKGDSVVINIADTKWADQGVFAINHDGKAIIKRLSYEDKDWWMVSENPDKKQYPRERCRLGHCIVVGRMVYRPQSWNF